MSVTLFHHPFSRAANVVWMLEELNVPYQLEFVDLMAGEQKSDAVKALNPMGKLPVLVDGDTVVSETSAVALYLGDRYGLGTLAPLVTDPARGPYLRWCLYAPSVIEPACMAKASGWTYRASSAGWGSYDDVLATLDGALSTGPYLLGDRFTMADVLVGGSMRWMLSFKMIDALPSFTAYVERISARPAAVVAAARNAAVVEERGLGRK